MKPKILITGATGNTGLPLVERLGNAGTPFRVLVHTPGKETLVTKGRAEVLIGDYADAASLGRALNGIERVYLLAPPSREQTKHQTTFVDIAREKGVKHIVKLSALGAAPDSPVGLLRSHAEIERHIREAGLLYTFLRPHFFMENLLGNASTVKRDGVIYSPLGEAMISPVSVFDIAAVAAKALTEDGHEGKTYVLTGHMAVTYERIAAILGGVIGKKVSYRQVSFEAAKQAMVMSGMPEWLADDLVRLMRTWTEGKGNIVSPDVLNVTGRRPLSLEAFFRRHRDAFEEQAVKAA